MTPVGFEPTPFRNGALSHRLRPLGQSVLGVHCVLRALMSSSSCSERQISVRRATSCSRTAKAAAFRYRRHKLSTISRASPARAKLGTPPWQSGRRGVMDIGCNTNLFVSVRPMVDARCCACSCFPWDGQTGLSRHVPAGGPTELAMRIRKNASWQTDRKSARR